MARICRPYLGAPLLSHSARTAPVFSDFQSQRCFDSSSRSRSRELLQRHQRIESRYPAGVARWRLQGHRPVRDLTPDVLAAEPAVGAVESQLRDSSTEGINVR
jgi:hypothetical protein